MVFLTIVCVALCGVGGGGGFGVCGVCADLGDGSCWWYRVMFVKIGSREW